jgi:MOSC domain-containing protein YiiM
VSPTAPPDHPLLLSVNVGQLEPLAAAATSASARKRSGIRKHPVGGPVLCDAQGLVGDAIGNTTHHGGTDQAIYLYSAEDYAWWSTTLGQPCGPGLFGENLTIDRWWPSPRVGDRVQWGEVLLELTAPRIPCNTLATRMGDPRFVTRFADARRPGAYARVLQSGVIACGERGFVTTAARAYPTIETLFRQWYRVPRDRSALIAALGAPLADRLRHTFLQWIGESAAQGGPPSDLRSTERGRPTPDPPR